MSARIDRVAPLVTAYREQHDPGEDDYSVLCDMLADLLHYADSVDIDPADAVRMAFVHHDAEVADDELNDAPVIV